MNRLVFHCGNFDSQFRSMVFGSAYAMFSKARVPAVNTSRKQGQKRQLKIGPPTIMEVIKLDDWAEIRHLYSTGKHSNREISRMVGVSGGTVDRALAGDRSPTYQREPLGSTFDAFASQVLLLLAATLRMPAATAAEREGWSGSASLFRSEVAQLRPGYTVPDPADQLVHPPGY